MMVWKMIFLYQGCLVRFHVNLPGCTCYTIRHLIQRWFLQVVLRMFLGTGKKEEGVCLDKTDLVRSVPEGLRGSLHPKIKRRNSNWEVLSIFHPNEVQHDVFNYLVYQGIFFREICCWSQASPPDLASKRLSEPLWSWNHQPGNPAVWINGDFVKWTAAWWSQGFQWLLKTCTSRKINMEPPNHLFGKENDLPNLHDYVPC